MKVSVGDKVLVFDPKLWGGKDKGDNSQFWKEAEIIHIDTSKYIGSRGDQERVATVRFDHDGRESPGHFIYAMKPLPSKELNEIRP